MKMNKNTLGFRLTVLFSTIMVPLLLVLFAAGYYAKNVVLTQVSSSYHNLVNSNLQMIEKSLKDITTNLVDIVDHDDNFQKFARPGLTDSEYYFARLGLIQRSQSYQAYYHTVDMFYLFSKPNNSLTVSNVLGNSEAYMDDVRGWITSSIVDPKSDEKLLYKWTIIQIHGDYYLNRIVSDGLSNKAYIGALIKIDSLKSPLNSLKLQGGGDVLLVGNNGTVLTSPTEFLGPEFRLPAEKMNRNSSFSFTNGKRKLFVISSHSPELGISMAVVLPDSELLQGLNYFQALANILPLFAFIVLLLYLYVFRRTVIRPILNLLYAIHRIRDGSMETKLPDSNLIEFKSLNHAFNSMVNEIQHLKIDVYEERLNAQNAELKHLQTQINPHFFQNTLNIIYQLADLNRTELVKKTVRHLVQYFRFMLQVKENPITLGQELDHLLNYLEIQKMRYQDFFEFDIDILEELKEASIPSLIVQPFVENAMIHGISMRNETFRLRLSAKYAEDQTDTMCIEITDNGKGTTDEKLAELNSSDYAPESEDRHIGIWNVKKRVTMNYGAEGRICFSHNEPSGLRVQLFLPVQQIKERDYDSDADCR